MNALLIPWCEPSSLPLTRCTALAMLVTHDKRDYWLVLLSRGVYVASFLAEIGRLADGWLPASRAQVHKAIESYMANGR